MPLLPVRPASPDERSDAIILSIDAKWMVPLKSGSLQWVIRKRLPFATNPSLVYFYAKSPLSAIIGRAKITAIKLAPIDFLLANERALQINSGEIRGYVGGSPETGLLQFERMQAARDPAKLTNLKRELEYFAPQSFAFVSRSALPIIDEMCGF